MIVAVRFREIGVRIWRALFTPSAAEGGRYDRADIIRIDAWFFRRLVMLHRNVIGIVIASVLVAFSGATAQQKAAGKAAATQPSGPRILKMTFTSDAKWSCYVARPAGETPRPAIILIHEWWGLNDWVKQQAERYAEMGYVAVAPDLYRGEVAGDAEHAHELMRGLTDERAVADLKGVFRWTSSRSFTKGKPIGVLGWCMGGGFALKLAIVEPRVACTVMCYGRPVLEVEQLKKIKGPLLGIWGATDRGIEVEPFKKALADAKVKATHHVYPGAGHAFLNETNKMGYNKEQAGKAWGKIDEFICLHLKG